MNKVEDHVNAESPASLPPPPRPSSRVGRRWLAALLGVAVFIAGGVVGAGLTLYFIRERVLYAIHHPQEVPARLSQQLKKTLGLNGQETERIREIIAKRQLRIQQLRRDVQPRVEAQVEDLRKEIADALPPEKAAQWNAWFEQMKQTWLPPPPEAPEQQP